MFDSFVTSWTVACQAPLSMGFPRQEYWSGLPFSSTGDLPDPGIEAMSPALAGGFFTTKKSLKKVHSTKFYILFPSHTHIHLNFPFVKLMKHLICGK